MSATETTPREVPAWLADMDFCHVFPFSTRGMNPRPAYCGHTSDKPSLLLPPFGTHMCSAKVSICKCGKPRCPRCAQLAALEDALDEA